MVLLRGRLPWGSSWTSDAAGCGVPCGITARRAPLSLDDQNSQGEWTQVILLSFYLETMWKLPACGRRQDRSPPAPCEFSLSPGLSSHSLTFSRWPELGPGHRGLRFRETRGEGLSPQEPVFRLRNCSPVVLSLPLLGDPAAPQDGYKHRDWGAPCGWSASFSPLNRAEDFLEHKPILPPTSTHPHSIFLKLFHPSAFTPWLHAAAVQTVGRAGMKCHSHLVCYPLGGPASRRHTRAWPVSMACGEAPELHVSAQFQVSAPPRLTQEAGGLDGPQPFGEQFNCFCGGCGDRWSFMF